MCLNADTSLTEHGAMKLSKTRMDCLVGLRRQTYPFSLAVGRRPACIGLGGRCTVLSGPGLAWPT